MKCCSRKYQKSLDFLGIENFEELNKCTEVLLKAFKTKSGNSSTISDNHDHENWYDPSVKELTGIVIKSGFWKIQKNL